MALKISGEILWAINLQDRIGKLFLKEDPR
jgi:hypothetical protein